MSEEWEYGFASPQTGLYYATTNVLLAETMHAARPEAELLRRPFVPWEPIDSTHEALEPVEFIVGEKVTVWGRTWQITSRTHHIDRGYYVTLQRADADGYPLATLDIWVDDLRSAL